MVYLAQYSGALILECMHCVHSTRRYKKNEWYELPSLAIIYLLVMIVSLIFNLYSMINTDIPLEINYDTSSTECCPSICSNGLRD